MYNKLIKKLLFQEGFLQLKEKLLGIKERASESIKNAVDIEELEKLRVDFLGKKGELTKILRGMGQISNEERPIVGKTANEIREELEELIKGKKEHFDKIILNEKLANQTIDITLNGENYPVGHEHPLYSVIDQMTEIFSSLGFSVVEGPEIEWAKYNFDYLNVPKEHSSRDQSDTFYFSDNILLRTQTSPVQIRAMLGKEPPIKIISPGKVYRKR